MESLTDNRNDRDNDEPIIFKNDLIHQRKIDIKLTNIFNNIVKDIILVV